MNSAISGPLNPYFKTDENDILIEFEVIPDQKKVETKIYRFGPDIVSRILTVIKPHPVNTIECHILAGGKKYSKSIELGFEIPTNLAKRSYDHKQIVTLVDTRRNLEHELNNGAACIKMITRPLIFEFSLPFPDHLSKPSVERPNN